MKRNLLFATLLSLLFIACTHPCPVCGADPCTCPEPDPEGTIYYTETDEIFANPERGFLQQVYYVFLLQCPSKKLKKLLII